MGTGQQSNDPRRKSRISFDNPVPSPTVDYCAGPRMVVDWWLAQASVPRNPIGPHALEYRYRALAPTCCHMQFGVMIY